MDSFCAIYQLKSLIKEPTCYTNPDKLTCIDLIWVNKKFHGYTEDLAQTFFMF